MTFKVIHPLQVLSADNTCLLGASAVAVLLFVCTCTEKEFSDMKLDELKELEDEIDEEDERLFEAYRLYCVD